jgi:hypothetical protein
VNVAVSAAPAVPDPKESDGRKKECASLVTQAQADEHAWHWDKASDKYAEAIKLCGDVRVDQVFAAPGPRESAARLLYARAYARLAGMPVWLHYLVPNRIKDFLVPYRPGGFSTLSQMYLHRRNKMQIWWYELGAYAPPLRWLFIYPWRCLVLIVLLAWGLAVLDLAPGSEWGTRVLAIFARLRPGRNNTIVIVVDGLDKEARSAVEQSALIPAVFAAGLQYSAWELKGLLPEQSSSLQYRSLSLVQESALPAGVADSLPEIKGINLAGIAKLFRGLWQYFGRWRIETHLAYFPVSESQTPAAGGVLTPKRIEVSAVTTSRWAWSSDPPVCVRGIVTDLGDIYDLAFATTARLFAVALWEKN